ncbi:MFS transporter [Paenibacillus pasadenensis]|uniref:MFS transporter n=1 Tax=Paenibacillus pasadenensis TaxID=217090 RepID=UPI002040D8A8|nr:MFS transporter [Paenibacillus pasadenensis]MCM3745785.1 MFS transporter [Paenibacillus pasadenensis]
MSTFIMEWRSQFGGYSRNIKLFFVFNLLWNIGLGMYSLIYNLYVKALGHAPTMVGDIVGATALASALVFIPAGVAGDRYGPKRMISIGTAAVIVVLAARAWADGSGSLTTLAFVSGIAQAIVASTILPFMANNSTPRERIHLFSFNMALVMGANVAGNLGGGFISDLLQSQFGLSAVSSLRATLLVGVAIAAAGLYPVLKFRNEPLASMGEPTFEENLNRAELKQAGWRGKFNKHRSSYAAIGVFTLLSLLSSMAGGMVVPYLNVYFEDRFHASNSSIGIVVALGQGATAIAFLLGPAIARRMGEVRAVVWLQLSSIPFLVLTAFTHQFWLASVGYLFRQALMNAANPFYSTIKMKYVHRSLRGLAASSGEAMFNLGWFIAAPISTGLVAAYGAYRGYASAFSITAIIYTIIALLFGFFFAKNRFKPMEEETEEVKCR